MTMAVEGVEGSASCPGRFLPPGKTWYPLYTRLGGPQGRSGQVRKISPTLGFDPRIVQPVASRYTVYDTRHYEAVLLEFSGISIITVKSELWRMSSQVQKGFTTLQRTLFMYLINKYISLSNICLTVHH